MLRSLVALLLVGCSGATSTEFFAAATADAGPAISIGATTPVADAGVDASTTKAPSARPPAETCAVKELPLNPADECDACDMASCCTEVQACDQDPSCTALVQCLIMCKDSTSCQQTCTKTFSDALPIVNDFVLCQKQSCVAQCE